MLSSFKQVLQKYHPLLLKIALIALQSKLLLKTWNIYLILKLYGTCHGLGYFGIFWAMSCPRIFLDTFGNIMA